MTNMNHREDCGICHGTGHTSSQCPNISKHEIKSLDKTIKLTIVNEGNLSKEEFIMKFIEQTHQYNPRLDVDKTVEIIRKSTGITQTDSELKELMNKSWENFLKIDKVNVDDVMSRRNIWMKRTYTIDERAEELYAKDSACYIVIKDVPKLVE